MTGKRTAPHIRLIQRLKNQIADKAPDRRHLIGDATFDDSGTSSFRESLSKYSFLRHPPLQSIRQARRAWYAKLPLGSRETGLVPKNKLFEYLGRYPLITD